MMATLIKRIKGAGDMRIGLIVPHVLEDDFERHFITADFDHVNNCWWMANNKDNRSKLQKWISIVENSELGGGVLQGAQR